MITRKLFLYIDDMYHNFTPDSNFFLYREQERMSCESQYNKLITLEKKIYQKNYKKYIKQIATELADVLPVIPLYSKHEIQLVSKRVHNLKPDTRGAFWNIHELIIEEKGNLQ
jgi:ABC-type transport system substrate-binding protein